jgi:hypothetical protein
MAREQKETLHVDLDVPAGEIVAALRMAVIALGDEASVRREVTRHRSPADREAAEREAAQIEAHAAIVNRLAHVIGQASSSAARSRQPAGRQDSGLLRRAERSLDGLLAELEAAQQRPCPRRVAELHRLVDEQRERVDAIRRWWTESLDRSQSWRERHR